MSPAGSRRRAARTGESWRLPAMVASAMACDPADTLKRCAVFAAESGRTDSPDQERFSDCAHDFGAGAAPPCQACVPLPASIWASWQPAPKPGPVCARVDEQQRQRHTGARRLIGRHVDTPTRLPMRSGAGSTAVVCSRRRDDIRPAVETLLDWLPWMHRTGRSRPSTVTCRWRWATPPGFDVRPYRYGAAASGSDPRRGGCATTALCAGRASKS